VHLVKRAHDLVRHGVVAAAGAERRLAALVIERLHAEAVFLRRFRSNFESALGHDQSSVTACEAAWGSIPTRSTFSSWSASLFSTAFVTARASQGGPVSCRIWRTLRWSSPSSRRFRLAFG